MATDTPHRPSPRYQASDARRVALLVLVGCIAAARGCWLGNAQQSDLPLEEGQHGVQRVIDGDTLVLASGHRVRLQGINSPELARNGKRAEPFAIQAKQYAQKFVTECKSNVRLSFTDERLDRYGRSLAFVWAGEKCLNVELVRDGLAEARLDYRFSGVMRRHLREAQQQAQDRRVGIWSE